MNWKNALTGLLSSLVVVLAFTQPTMAFDESESTETPAVEVTEESVEETEEAPALSLSEIYYALDNSMLFLCAVLVLFMQSGFAMVESGFNSSKNTINILFKNLMDVCAGVLIYYAIGYGLMYPGDNGNGYFGFGQFGIGEAGDAGPGVLHPQVDFLFQVAFAATAATIVSGAVAGRMKFSSYLIYSIVLTGIIYPISGYWKWGGGWLDAKGFYDFAGSIVVHAVGGFAGLAGALVLGPRIGRFKEGKSSPIPGHNIAQATLGVFILWVGWYGFNPGSQLAFAGTDNTNAVMLIATNTTLAAATGGVAAMVLGWLMYGKPDISMALNGVLAGLVGITANCDSVTNVEAIAIGGIAGVLVVGGILALEKLRIDDPVGAFPVHGLCGIWGGVATGIFGDYDLGVQILGSIVIPVYAFITMFVLFFILKVIGQLRVSEEDELKGLDLSEHGMQAYH
ncbi:ammonium transporter [Gimesia aquarii]|uniref:Ammonium transporter n=1 Tax=Gimesia aquarii TaxID=2527964 RepID=A0A517WS05_9PLAN|nr:ammonium transporter [Gimesia aquarii]QDU08008.1 Ammonium transporter NrgA [Gimesia aquarii]